MQTNPNLEAVIQSDIQTQEAVSPTPTPEDVRPIAEIPESEESLLSDMDKFDSEQKEMPPVVGRLGLSAETPTSDADLIGQMEKFDDVGVLSPEAVSSREQGMELSRGTIAPIEANNVQTINDLSKELNIDPAIIEADLEVYSPEQIRKRHEIPQIARDFPVLSKWMARPENYVLAENTGDWTKTLSQSAKNLNPVEQSELADALKSGLLEYPKSAVHTLMLSGAMSIPEGVKALKAIELKQQEYVPGVETQRQMEVLAAEDAAGRPAMKEFWDSLSQNFNAVNDRMSPVPPDLMKLYNTSVDALGVTLDYMKSMYENPEGASINIAHVATSSGIPLIVGAGGAIAGHPFKGAFAAGTIAGVLSAGESIQEDLEEFRDPRTGDVDYIKAYSDADRIARWQKRAATYAGVMAASEFIYSKYIGAGFVKLIKSSGQKLAKEGVKAAVKEGVKTLAKDVAIGAVEEGATELTASLARDAVVGELTDENIVNSLNKAKNEAIYGAILGGAAGSVKVGVRTGKQAYFKLKTELGKASKANEDMVALSELRTILNSNTSAKTHKDQVKDLVGESVKLPPLPDTTEIYDNVEEVTDAEAGRRSEEAVHGTVQVVPSELDAFFQEQGTTLQDEVSLFPTHIQQLIADNVESDSAVNILVEDWVDVLVDFPEVDEIVRVNGNEYNAREANDIVENVQQNPFPLFSEILPEDQIEEDDIGEEEIPPVPLTEEELAAEEKQTKEVPLGEEEVIKLTDIKTPFRNEDDTKAYNTIVNRMRRGVKGVKGISKEAANIFAEVQYTHHKTRAEATGRNILELAKSQKIQSGRSSKVYGSFNRFFNKLFFGHHADAATVVHEFGHSWLDEMSEDYTYVSNLDINKMTDTQRAYWYSMEKTAELLGLDNMGVLNSMDPQSKVFTQIHESFAQTSEEYFLSGKFKGSKIKAVMESFRKYMSEIIDSIRRYAGKVSKKGYRTLDITPEVERLFEGIIGVDYASDETLRPMFENPMFSLDDMGANAQEYYNTAQDALMEAVGVFASKIMKSSYNTREGLINSALNESYDRAAEEVDSTPAQLFSLQMKDQYEEYKANKKAGKKVLDPRMSWVSFLGVYSGNEKIANAVKATLPSHMVAPKKRGGVDASTIMYESGLTDLATFQWIIEASGKRDALIEKRADEIIDENYPILKSDMAIRNDAVESLSNEKQSKFLNMEMKILATKYLPTLKNLAELFIKTPEHMMSKENIREEASKLVSTAKAFRFSPRLFRVSYARHTNQAATYFRLGNFAAAFDSKVKSAIAYVAYVQGVAIQKQLTRTDKRVKIFNKYTKGKDYKNLFNAEMIMFGRRFIEVVQTGKGEIPTLSLDMFPDVSDLTVVQVQTVNKTIETFKERTGGRVGAFINVENYIEFGEVIRTIMKVSKDMKLLEIEGKEISMLEAVDQTVGIVEKSPTKVISYKKKGLGGHYRAEFQTAHVIIRSFFKDQMSYVQSLLGRADTNLEKGQARSNHQKRIDYDRLFNAFGKISKASTKGTLSQEILGPVVSHIPFMGEVWKYNEHSKPIVSSELGMTFNNFSELITATLLMGSHSGAEKFLRGGTESHPLPIVDTYINGEIDTAKWKVFQARMIEEGILRKEHFDAMQEIWDMFEEKHAPLKKAFRKTDGYLIGKIEGWGVETPWGTYKGAYIPVAQDRNLIDAANFESLLDMDTQLLSGMDMYPGQNTGMTNQRTSTFNNVSLDANRLMSYISAVNDIIYMREELIAFGKILSHPEVKAAIEAKRPGAYANVFLPWFERARNQRRVTQSQSGWDNMAMFLKKNINRSVYLANAMTPLKQVFGVLPAATRVKKRYLFESSVRVGAHPNMAVAQMVATSPVMRDRLESGEKRHVVQEWDSLVQNFDYVAKLDRKVDWATFVAIQYMQNRTDAIVWHGAIAQAEVGGLSRSEAIAFADMTVQTTQSSSAISNLNNAQARGGMIRLIQGMATSYSFAMYNIISEYTLRTPTAKANALKLASLMAFVVVLPSIMDAALEGAVDAGKAAFDDDEEKRKRRLKLRREGKTDLEDRLENLSLRSATGMLGPLLPVVGSGIASLAYGQVALAPMLAKASREGAIGLKGAYRATQGVALTPREIKAMLQSITIFLGVPTSVLAKDILIEDLYIEGLSGEDLDARMRERRRDLRRIKREQRRR